MATQAPPRPTGGNTSRPRRLRDELRELTLRLHFYVGLFIAPFLLVAAATGILYALTPQIEQVVYDKELHASAPAGAEMVPLAQQIEAAQSEVTGGTITQIRPPKDPESTTRVTFDSPSAREDRQLTAFVDPYTGEVTGVLNTFGEWLPLRTWFDDLHRNLHLGDAGRWYSEVAASWLWVLALSGLIIWVTRKVRARTARAYLLPQRKGPQRQRSMSLHATIGVWAAIGLFFLSATGLTWSQFAGGNFSALRQSLSWSTPYLSSEAATTTPVAEVEVPATAQSVLEVTRQEGLTDPVAITPSTDGGAWVVSQVQRSWPLKQDSMAIDPDSVTVVETVRFADWPIAGKLAEAGISFHMGILFGWPNQLLLIAIAGAVITLIVIGYRMWWRRRPKQPRTGLPTTLGRRVDSAAAYGILIAIAAVVGLALPLLGVTLAAFLAFDLARRVLQSARAERPRA